MNKSLIILLISIFAVGYSFADIFMYIDKEGQLHFAKEKIGPEYRLYMRTNPPSTMKSKQLIEEKIASIYSIPSTSTVLPQIPSELAKGPITTADLFKTVQSSIFTVIGAQSEQDLKNNQNLSQGSAVAISANKLLTNYHVIKAKRMILVFQQDECKVAKIIGQNTRADLCVLEISEKILKPIKAIRKYDELSIGETVYTIGTPVGLEKTMADGIISSLRRNSGIKYIQISAPISPGSSGGGLFDSKGNLIGITTFQIRDMQNLNFAIAVEEFWN